MAARIFDKNSYRERYHRYWEIPQLVDTGEGIDFKSGRLRMHRRLAGIARSQIPPRQKPPLFQAKNRQFPAICLFFRNKAVKLEYHGAFI